MAIVTLDQIQRAIQVPTGFEVHRHPVRTGISKRWNVIIRVLDHQVTIEREFGGLAERPHQLRAEGDVGDKMPVHHVHVNDAPATRCGARNLICQMRKIRR